MEDKAKINHPVTARNLFNISSLQYADVIYICEKVEDANAFIVCGAEAVAIENLSNINIMLEAAKQYKSPVYMLALDTGAAEDGSNPGGAAQLELYKAMKAAGITARTCNPNLLYIGHQDARTAKQNNSAAFMKVLASIKADIIKEKAAADLYKRTGAGMLESFMEEVQTPYYKPIPTGINNIDYALDGGIMRKTLITLGAAPGMGKTTIAQWILENIAQSGHDVLYINLEMDRAQLIARSLARTAHKYAGNMRAAADLTALDIMRGYKWTPEQRQAVTYAIDLYREKIAKHFIYNPEGVNNKLSSILEACKAEAERLKTESREAPIVCIDYLQLIENDQLNTAGRISEASEGLKRSIVELKNFAKAYNTTVFLIIANNRSANREGRGTMDSGRDTSTIEYTGDVMLTLGYTAIEDGETYIKGTDRNGNDQREKITPDYIDFVIGEAEKNGQPRPEIANRLCLKIVKSRFNEPGKKARFIFDGKHSTFTEIDIYRKPPEGY